MAGSVNWNGPTNPSFPKSTRRNVLKASRSAPLAISPLQTLFPEGSPTRSPTFSPPHAVPGAGPRPHGPKGAAKHSPETPRPTTPAPAPSPTLSCRSAPQGGPVGTPLRPPRPDRFPEGTPPSAPADGGPQAWRPRVEPISPDSRSSLSSLSPQLPGTVSPGQPVACAVAGWAEAPDAGPRSAADCAAEPSSSSSSSSSDLAPDSLAQGCPMHYSSHYDYQPLSRYPCHPFGRCSHKPQWERLRSKRGYTYFQCQECGLTWRQLTKTQDSAQNKGFDKACAGILEKGIEALSKDLTSRNVSDLGLGTAALSHLPDDLWDQPPPAVPLPSLDGLQLNGMPSTAPHARARRGSCCSAQDQAIASPDWDPEDSMALSARSQTSARSSTWSALSGWTDHGLTLNDSAGFADSCQESDGGPQRAEEGAPP